jgi:hypothetical protein
LRHRDLKVSFPYLPDMGAKQVQQS